MIASAMILALGVAIGTIFHKYYQIEKSPPPVIYPNTNYTFDKNFRLLNLQGRKREPCPGQNTGDLVLLVIGQSNASNSLGDRYRSLFPGRIINYYSGKCFEASSPLIGASGASGELWTDLGNTLVKRGTPKVIIIPHAIDGSQVKRWASGGDLNTEMLNELRVSAFRPTHVIWLQGEADWEVRTAEQAYRESFLSLAGSLRRAGLRAPIYVAVTSRCDNPNHRPGWTADNPVTRAQRSLPNGRDILAGPDTDHMVTVDDRTDGCHFSGRGGRIVSQWFADKLAPKRGR